jgi:hypothetical protein
VALCIQSRTGFSLQHGQRPHLGLADPRGDTNGGTPRNLLRKTLQQVIGTDIQCGREGVQVGVHENLRFDVAGVKGSQVQILSSRQKKPQLAGIGGFGRA